MAISGGFGFTLDIKSGRTRRYYMKRDGIKRWFDNDQPVDEAPTTEPVATTASDAPAS